MPSATTRAPRADSIRRPTTSTSSSSTPPVQSVPPRPGLHRISPAKKDNSLLWLNVAAATLPSQWRAPRRAMPLGGLAPLSLDELEVLRLWIEAGAPREDVVPGSGELVDACLPPPAPLETKPLAPPPPGTGIQLRGPRQILAPHSERETCFVTYYDLTDQVPAQFRGPGGDTFRYKRLDARQDPLSHHAVVIPYGGATSIHYPVWGPFTWSSSARPGATPLGAQGGHGTPCSAPLLPRVGDCDQQISVEELLTGVNIALGQRPLASCADFDGDGDGEVRVDELLAAIDVLLNPMRDPDESLLYNSLSYSDPAVARFDPPLRLGGVGSTDAARTLTYCALYDNGASDPAQVKRQSTSPLPTANFPGGPCLTPQGCTTGRVGATCGGSTPAERDASCDSSPDAGDGDCDACPVAFGTTTEDEMFVLLGAFYAD